MSAVTEPLRSPTQAVLAASSELRARRDARRSGIRLLVVGIAVLGVSIALEMREPDLDGASDWVEMVKLGAVVAAGVLIALGVVGLMLSRGEPVSIPELPAEKRRLYGLPPVKHRSQLLAEESTAAGGSPAGRQPAAPPSALMSPVPVSILSPASKGGTPRRSVERTPAPLEGPGAGVAISSPAELQRFMQSQVAAPELPLTDLDATSGASRESMEKTPYRTAFQGSGTRSDDFLAESAARKTMEKLGLGPAVLSAWTDNLRKWFARHLLRPLATAIDAFDATFTQAGFVELKVSEPIEPGSPGWMRLDAMLKWPQTRPLAEQRFLLEGAMRFRGSSASKELRDYVVERIRTLAQGGFLSDFRWDGGGPVRGRPWSTDLPTDSALLLQLFAAFLDLRLPDVRSHSGQPFSAMHLVVHPDRPGDGKERSRPLLYQSKLNPPHFAVVDMDGDLLETFPGRTSVFQALCLFLHQLRLRSRGYLGPLNLANPSIDLMRVVSVAE